MLKIEKVKVYKIFLTYTSDYSISQRQGVYSDNNIIVEIVTENEGITGYGEGVPVEIVTGETQESAALNALKFVQSYRFPWELNNVNQVWDYIDSLPMSKENNAAICALETALLDAVGKYEKKSILTYFPQDHYTSSINYGAPITLGDEAKITELCRLIKSTGIRDLRIKLCRDLEQNKVTIKIVRKILGEDCDIRVDPNSVWDEELALKHIPLIIEHKVKIVEEPMKQDDDSFKKVARILKDNGIILMACESAPTLADVERIIDEGYYQMINVKLNRSGGFRRSLKIIEYIRKEGLFFQIGCTLGESGILSAGGRALCLLNSDALYYDGSYDIFLLEKNVTKEHVTFGRGGEAGPLQGFGLGVEVSRENLAELKKQIATIRRDA
jgi:muconate cycloisomerase